MLSSPESPSNEGAEFSSDDIEDSSGNDLDPICDCGCCPYSPSSDVYDSDDYDAAPCSCDGCSSWEESFSTRIPHSCPYWEYCWSDVTLTSSGVTMSPSFIQLPRQVKTVRLGVSSTTLQGLKNLSIYCYLNHKEKKMGWTIQTVTCLYQSDKMVELKNLETYDTGDELLTATITDPPEDAEGPMTLKFRFHITGSAYNYQRCDMQLGAQLWEAAVKQQTTDVVFLVGDRSFPAHKFLLAARSPVFSVMFGTDMVESRTGRVKVDDADPDTFQQFLRFLYTGQLEEPASKELAYVADKYDVKTLSAIWESAAASSDEDAESSFDSVRSAEATTEGDPSLPPFLDHRMTANFWKSEDASIIGDVSSAVCEERGHSLLASMLICCRSDYSYERKPHFFRGSFMMPDQIRFSAGWAGQDASRIVDVFCSSKRCISDYSFRYFTRMMPLNDPTGSEGAEPTKQEFTVTPHPEDLPRIIRSSEVPIEFLVCHSPSIPEFRYAFRDRRLSKELWSSSVNKEWTDVDFVVGDKTFSAHRALLAARCPALIPPGSNLSSTVKVENLESSVFEDLLYFVYTGELQTFPPSEALYEAALSYEVDLLMRLFEMGGPKPKVADDISPDSADLPME